MTSFTILVARLALSFVFAVQIWSPVTLLAPAHEWVEVNRPSAPGGIIQAIAQSDSEPNILYTLVDDLQGSRLYRSADRSGSWTFINYFSTHMSELAIDPGNVDTLYLGSVDGLYRSADGGLQWDKISELSGPFAAPAAGMIYVMGKSASSLAECPESGIVFSWSSDGGLDWNTSAVGCFSVVSRIAVVDGQPDMIYAVASIYVSGPPWPMPINYEYLVRSLDRGQTWESFEMPNESRCSACSDLVIDPANPQHIMGHYDAFFMSSLDGGETWELNTNYNLGVNCDWGCDLRIAVSGRKIFALPLSTLSQPAFFSEDGGLNWFRSIKNLPAGVFALTADASQPGRLYAGTIGYGVFRSEDAGATWIDANQGIQTLTRLNALAVAPSDPNIFYAASDYPRPALFCTLDGGQTWSPPLLDQLYESPFSQAGIDGIKIKKIAIHPQNPEIVWAGGNNGLFSTEFGSHWSKVGNSGNIYDLKVSPSFPEQPYALMYRYSYYLLDREPDFTGFLYGWHERAMGFGADKLAINPTQKGSILVADNIGTNYGLVHEIFSTNDSGKSFQKIGEINADGMMADLVFSPINPDVVYAAFMSGNDLADLVMVSGDGGATWDPWVEGLNAMGFGSDLEIDPVHQMAYFGSKGVFSRNLAGAQWQLIGFEGEQILAMSLSTHNTQFLLASTADGLWKLDLFTHSTWLPVVTK